MAKTYKKPDYLLLGIVVGLIALGLLILSSVSAPFAFKIKGDTYYFLKHQILFGLLPGLILGFIFYKLNLSFLRKNSPFLLLFSLALMVMVFLPVIGTKLEGASRWINLGPISFQPAELLKLAFILYLATWLSSRMEKTAETQNQGKFDKTFLAFVLVIILISFLLFLQRNVSTLGIICSVAVLMYFSANTPWWQSILMILTGIAGLFFLIKIEPYRVNRLLIFLNPEIDPMGKGYQLKQALISVGSGGLKGTGLGMSIQRFGFLPQSISDSIFAVFAEETGFIGSAILIFVFLIFAWQGLKIAKRSRDTFQKLTALGVTSWIIIQSFVNIGAMTGILPLTGIPLPFISYGGSALTAELMAVGILLNISKQT